MLPGNTLEDRLEFLNDDIGAYYAVNHIQNRLPPFKVENIKDGPFPILKGNNVKAANTRSLVPYILSFSERAIAMNNSELNRHMLKVIASVHGIIQVVYTAGVFLTPGARRSCDPSQSAGGATTRSSPLMHTMPTALDGRPPQSFTFTSPT